MGTLLVVGNPARKRRKSRKAASPAQLRARAAFAARARAGSRKRRNTVRANPAPTSNPIRRRRRSAGAVSRRRVRRNPIGGSLLRGIVPQLKDAAIGAGGAVAVEIAYGYAKPYLPDMVQEPVSTTGGLNPAYYAAKGALAIALGIVARKALGAKAARMVEGSLTVTMHDAAKQFIAGSGMGITLGAAAQQLPPLPVSRRLRGDMGEYVSGPRNRSNMGEYVSAGAREGASYAAR